MPESLDRIQTFVEALNRGQTVAEWLKIAQQAATFFSECTAEYETDGNTPGNGAHPILTPLPRRDWMRVDELFVPQYRLRPEQATALWQDSTSRFLSALQAVENPNHRVLLGYVSDGSFVNFVSQSFPDNKTAQQSLMGCFPGAALTGHTDLEAPGLAPDTSSDSFLAKARDAQSQICWFGGVPAVASPDGPLPIDKFLASLYGDEFAWFIGIVPLEATLIRRLAAHLESELDRVAAVNHPAISFSTGLGGVGSLQFSFPLASGLRLAELITRDIERCREGLDSGFWQTEIMLCTRYRRAAAKGRRIALSVFGGPTSGPMQFQSRDQMFTTYLTSRELGRLVGFPSRDFPGLQLKPLYSLGAASGSQAPDRLNLGHVLLDMQPTSVSFGLAPQQLTKHVLVCGITGSGKTTTVKRILSEAAGQGIPFLVIEPAKAEYCDLEKEIPGTIYLEIGKDDFRLNPFRPVAGTHIVTHIDYLRAVFGAAFVLYPPMPYILEKALYRAYSDKGFVFKGKDSIRRCPTLADLQDAIVQVVDDAGFSRIREDILASLKVRIENLRVGFKDDLFNSQDHIPDVAALMSGRYVIGLRRVVDDEQKALVIGLLLALLYEHREAAGPSSSLKHLTVVEEAHRVMTRVGDTSGNPESAHPRAHAVQFFANLLAEIRAFGEGLIIAEQIPSKLISDVVKNTETKLVHKLVASDDRELLARTMNFLPDQERLLTILRPGQAVVFTGEMVKPVAVAISSPRTRTT